MRILTAHLDRRAYHASARTYLAHGAADVYRRPGPDRIIQLRPPFTVGLTNFNNSFIPWAPLLRSLALRRLIHFHSTTFHYSTRFDGRRFRRPSKDFSHSNVVTVSLHLFFFFFVISWRFN